MKKIVLILSLFLAFGAQAEEAWETEVKKVTELAADMPVAKLSLEWLSSVSAATMVCGVDKTLVVTSLVADTLPVANLISEVLANATDEDYRSLESNTFFGSIADVVMGAFGGASYMAKDSVQYMLLLLYGEEDKAWQSTKKAYESSLVLIKKSNSNDTLCNRASRIEYVYRKEMLTRMKSFKGELQQPIAGEVEQY